MRHRWGLPLLAKELIEQSARRRTYAIRTLYAVLLFAFALLIFWASVYQEVTSPLDVLGRGREIFMAVVMLQVGGVFLFMPAITCGVITAEKERNTIGLLLLTRLGPTTILLEKLLGRLVPMGTFLLLSLPLMGFAYSLGGITQQQVWVAIWALAITAVQVGALALACSAFFRTTVQSFIATYVLGFLMYFGWGFLCEMSDTLRVVNEVWTRTYVGLVNAVAWTVWPFSGEPPQFDMYATEFSTLLLGPLQLLERWNMDLWHVIPRSLPACASVVVLFLLARLFVVRRAFVPPRNLLLKFFHRLDELFQRINQNRVTKGIVLIRESTRLPDDDPVAWRETRKKSLGTTRYLVRIFIVTEVPVLLLCTSVAMTDMGQFSSGASEAVSLVLFLFWILTALLVCVKGATLISGERSHETLDVLLSTPIGSEDLLRQKFRGVRRLMLVLACPLLTIILFQAYFRMALWPSALGGYGNYRRDADPLLYLTASLPTVAIYLPLMAWVSFAIGLGVRSQTRAIFGALAAVAGWCTVPLILAICLHEGPWHFRYGQSPVNYTFLLSPASIIAYAEFSDLGDLNSTPWRAAIGNALLYWGILLGIRQWCLSTAARRLGRAERAGREPDLPPPVSRFPVEWRGGGRLAMRR